MNRTITRLFLPLCLLTCMPLPFMAQGNIHEQSDGYEWPTEPKVLEHLKEWQNLKFGVLLHWGIYAVPGIVESWSICDEDWISRDTTMTYQQYKEWYWGQAELFNPTNFNPKQWADAMTDAGMKYVIFTTKHHDGFCMFDSKQTDYGIAHHAFRNHPLRDVAKHVFDAFRQQDFMIGAYFSKPDWHSQYYWWDVFSQKGRNINYSVEKYPWRWEQFKKFTHNQIEELMTGYGKIDILWLDGGWVYKENRRQDIDMPGMAAMARSHQPNLIIVDRTIRGPYENYQTPERTIPETQLNHPWESCIPLSDDWGYVKHPQWKSPMQVINTLAEIVAKGGSLVLGVGPTPEGLIQPEVTERLHAIGNWMRKNGKAIYSTVTTPLYHSGDIWFTADKDGKTRYAIYALEDGKTLPSTITWEGNIPKKGTKVVLLQNGRKLTWKVEGNQVTVTLPKNMPQESFALQFTADN